MPCHLRLHVPGLPYLKHQHKLAVEGEWEGGNLAESETDPLPTHLCGFGFPLKALEITCSDDLNGKPNLLLSTILANDGSLVTFKLTTDNSCILAYFTLSGSNEIRIQIDTTCIKRDTPLSLIVT